MFPHFLNRDQDLEQLRLKLSEQTGRPAFVVSYPRGYGLSRLFDLSKASRVYLVYPLLPEERKAQGEQEKWDADARKYVRQGYTYDDRANDPNIWALGLGCDWNIDPSIAFVSDGETVPEELLPFVHTYPTDFTDRLRERKGIRFAVSSPIEKPTRWIPIWNLGPRTFNEKKQIGIQIVQAPAWYSDRPVTDAQPINHLALIQRQASATSVPGYGCCVVCHGASGETIHLGFTVRDTHGSLICKACFPEAAKAWQALLDSWTPPTEEETTK